MSVEFPHVRTVAASVLGEPDAIINRNIPMGNVDPPAIVEIEVTQSRLVEDPRGSLQGVGAALEPQSDRIPQDDAVSEKFDDMSYARVGLILASLGLCTFLYAIEQTIVATAVSDIGIGVKATGSLTWITTSYLLTITVIQPITGRLSDVFGAKNMLIGEVWIFILGNIVAGTARRLPQLVAGRLLSGVGGAGLLALSTIIVSQLTHERQRGSYLNLINFVFIIADSLGPIVGGFLAQSGQWRWIFRFNAPFGPVITLVLIFAVRFQTPKIQHLSLRSAVRSLDATGMMLLISCLTLLIVALNIGGDAYPWDSKVVIGLFVGSAFAFLLFIVAENFASFSIVPMGLFASWEWRNVPIMTVVRCLLFFHLYATIFYVPIFLQVTGHTSVLAAALVIPFLLMAAISSIITINVASKFVLVRPVFLAALAVLPVGMGLMSTLNEASPIGQIVGYSLICGVGFGSGTQLTMVITQAGLSKDLLPTVTAFTSATPNLGGVLGVGIIGTIINSAFRRSLRGLVPDGGGIPHINDAVLASQDPIIGDKVTLAYVQAFQLGFRILAGIAVFKVVLCLGLKKVVLNDGKEQDIDITEEKGKKEKANVEVVQPVTV